VVSKTIIKEYNAKKSISIDSFNYEITIFHIASQKQNAAF